VRIDLRLKLGTIWLKTEGENYGHSDEIKLKEIKLKIQSKGTFIVRIKPGQIMILAQNRGRKLQAYRRDQVEKYKVEVHLS